jgi:hypothetical protein
MKTLSVKTYLVTPDQALEWATDNQFPQRPLNNARVNAYATLMEQGKWEGGDGMIVLSYRARGLCLIAGNHRLHAIVKANIPVSMTVCEREYDSDAEMESDYASRTNDSQPFTMHQRLVTTSLHDDMNVNTKQLRSAIAAIRLIAVGFGDAGGASISSSQLRNADTMKAALVAWETPIRAYTGALRFADKESRKWYERSPVFAIGISTFRFQPEKAQQFWEVAMRNDALAKGDPRHALHMFLATNSVNARGVAYSRYLRHIASLWNAHYLDRQIAKFTSPQTFYLEGTPFTKTAPSAVGLSLCLGKDKI